MRSRLAQARRSTPNDALVRLHDRLHQRQPRPEPGANGSCRPDRADPADGRIPAEIPFPRVRHGDRDESARATASRSTRPPHPKIHGVSISRDHLPQTGADDTSSWPDRSPGDRDAAVLGLVGVQRQRLVGHAATWTFSGAARRAGLGLGVR